MQDTNTTPTPTRGIEIKLDRLRHLRFTLGTLRRIREEIGTEALEAGVSEEKLAKVLWYGLKEDDPTLKPEDVEDLIDLQDLPELVEALKRAMGGKAKASVALSPSTPAASAETPVG